MGCGSSSPSPSATYAAIRANAFVLPPPPANPTALRRVAVIVNPNAGARRGRAALNQALVALTSKGISATSFETSHAGHAIDLAAAISPTDFDAVIVIGGDGTLHEVFNGLAYTSLTESAASGRPPAPTLPIGVIPCGTGNVVLLSATGANTVDDALDVIFNFRIRPIDVIEVTRPDDVDVPRLGQDALAVAIGSSITVEGLKARVRYAVCVACWGLSSAIVAASDRLRWMGAAQYNAAIYGLLLYNQCYVTSIDFVDPPGIPHPTTLAAIDTLRTAAEAIQGIAGRSPSGTPGQGTAAASSDVTLSTSVSGLTQEQPPVGAHASTPRSGESSSVPESREPDAAPTSSVPTPSDEERSTPAMPAPPASHTAYVTLHAQTTPFIGEGMAFCPLARLDDGLMDLTGVLASSRLRLAGTMEAAKAGGTHMLGPRPLPTVVSCQAREVVLRPLPAGAAQEAWVAGRSLAVPLVQEDLSCATAVTGLDAEAAALAKQRAHLSFQPLLGERTLNVDGELAGPAPARLRVVSRVLRLLA